MILKRQLAAVIWIAIVMIAAQLVPAAALAHSGHAHLHSAGAAVDLTLCTEDGQELDLGTSVNANPEESNGACYTGHPSIGEDARRNRAILAAALDSAGFVNYPTEWWHWSYGDRYWAMTTGAPTAIYGPSQMR